MFSRNKEAKFGSLGAMSRNSLKLVRFLNMISFFFFFLVRGFIAVSNFQRVLGHLRKDQQPGQCDSIVGKILALQEDEY